MAVPARYTALGVMLLAHPGDSEHRLLMLHYSGVGDGFAPRARRLRDHSLARRCNSGFASLPGRQNRENHAYDCRTENLAVRKI